MTWASAFFWLGVIVSVLCCGSFWALVVLAGIGRGQERLEKERDAKTKPEAVAKAFEDATKREPSPGELVELGAMLRKSKKGSAVQ